MTIDEFKELLARPAEDSPELAAAKRRIAAVARQHDERLQLLLAPHRELLEKENERLRRALDRASATQVALLTTTDDPRLRLRHLLTINEQPRKKK